MPSEALVTPSQPDSPSPAREQCSPRYTTPSLKKIHPSTSKKFKNKTRLIEDNPPCSNGRKIKL
jgi:hypothetical protein